MKLHYVFLTFLFLLFGCQKPDSIKINELNQAISTWKKANIKSYSVTQKISCYCMDEFILPKRLVIVDQKVVSVNGSPIPEEELSVYLTVEDSFEFIKDRLAKNPIKSSIEYDDTYGFPSSFHFDMSEQIVDEEISYYFTDFTLTQ